MAEQGGPADGTLRALTNGVGSRHSAASRLDRTCCRSSVVERILGKAEVVSSILTGSTTQTHVSGIGETHPVLSRKGPAVPRDSDSLFGNVRTETRGSGASSWRFGPAYQLPRPAQRRRGTRWVRTCNSPVSPHQ